MLKFLNLHSLGLVLVGAIMSGVFTTAKAQDTKIEPPSARPSVLEDADGDGIPDSKDPSPIVADPLELNWSISEMTIGWEIRQEKVAQVSREDTETLEMLTQKTFSFGGEVKTEVGASGKIKTSTFTPFSAEASAYANFSMSGDCSWRKKEQEQATETRRIFSSLTAKALISNPFVEFTVTFRNNGPVPYRCQDFEIPVMIGDQELTSAVFKGAREEATAFEIAANRRMGTPYKFRANLDNTIALKLLDYMTVASPSFKIEKARGTIVASGVDGQQKDAIALTQNLVAKTCLVRILSPDGKEVSWRIARRHKNRDLTIGDAIDAINKLFEKENLPVFVIENGMEVKSVAGWDNDYAGWWWVRQGRTIVNEESYLKLPLKSDLVFSYDKGRPKCNFNNFETLAKKGDPWAQFFLGKLYYLGEGVDKDLAKAVEWYRKAADQGNTSAQNNLGFCYFHGEGVAKDLVEAMKWYRKAADQGYAMAQNNLGICYYQAKDLAKAVEWYRKAANQGESSAQRNLGDCYYNGEGTPKDLAKAVEWYRKAADQGEVDAQNRLGVCYYNGEGIDKDLVEAVKWWRKATDQGNTSAQNNLGFCYFHGEGVPKDLVKAVKWYRKAADQGNPLAQNHLGFCYYNGEGVPKDLTEAMKWWRKSALDHILCTTDLAKELENQGWIMRGRGYVFDILKQDENLKSWLKKAVVVGGEIGVDGQIKFPVRLEMYLSSKAGIEPWEYEASGIFFLEEGKIKFHDIWLRAGTLGRTRCVYISAEAGMKELTWDLHRK